MIKRTNFVWRYTGVVITICYLSYPYLVVSYAQRQSNTPKAIKFNEYVYTNDEDEKVHLSSFAAALKRYPKARAYVIGYGDPFYPYGEVQRADHARKSLFYLIRSLIEWDKVVTVDGGFREKETVELYIVPRGASPPEPTPTVPISDVTFCPLITVESPIYVWRTDKPLTFRASVMYVNQNVTPTYKWTISEGKIIGGQGTQVYPPRRTLKGFEAFPQIDVALPEGDYRSITATLEVDGFSSKCLSKGSTASPAAMWAMPHKFDEYGDICDEDEMARLDAFHNQLRGNPELQAYIIFYGGRCYSSCGYDYPRHRPRRPLRGEAEARASRTESYLVNERNLGPERIFVTSGGHRESWTAELWIVPKGEKPPPLSPTVQPQDVIYRKGERDSLPPCL